MFLDTSLTYFYEVARAGSIRRAAEQLHVSPSAISRMIVKVEHYFRCALFERRPQGMTLTAAGQALFDEVSDALTHLQEARSRIDALNGLQRGQVILHCIEGFAAEVVPSLLSDFHQRYPEVEISVNVDGSDRIVELLLGNSIDIGIIYNNRYHPGIEILASTRQPLCGVVSPAHSLARQRTISLRELLKHPITMLNTGSGTRQVLDSTIKRLQLPKPTIVLLSNSLTINFGLIAASDLVGLATPLGAHHALKSGQLVALPLKEWRTLSGTVSLCKRRGRKLSASAEALASSFKLFLESSNYEYIRP